MMPEALLELLEIFSFMFIESAWKTTIPIQSHVFYVYLHLVIELHRAWESQCKKKFIKYSVATKNKILGIPDVSPYEHIRIQSWTTGEERMCYS